MSDVAVSIRGLTKIYTTGLRLRRVEALRNVNLEIEAGQVYGLLGPNGSGKTTTLKVILGLTTPTVGESRVFGIPSAAVASRHAVGFLPENPYFPKYLTAAETLRFFGRLSGLTGKELRDRIERLLDMVGLTDARDRRLGTFSTGMLQRTGLAQALIADPRLLILDEPTAGVDPRGSGEICRLIADLRNRGTTVLLSSHLLDQAEEICDRVAILANGSLVREGKLSELISQPNRVELLLENASEEVMTQIMEGT